MSEKKEPSLVLSAISAEAEVLVAYQVSRSTEPVWLSMVRESSEVSAKSGSLMPLVVPPEMLETSRMLPWTSRQTSFPATLTNWGSMKDIPASRITPERMSLW